MSSSSRAEKTAGSSLRWSAWNLVLLIPLLILFTPLYNTARPSLFGLPYFYWYQLLFVAVGVLCVSIVVVATRDKRKVTADRKPLDVDELDEGTDK
jgi:hypothetical protein